MLFEMGRASGIAGTSYSYFSIPSGTGLRAGIFFACV